MRRTCGILFHAAQLLALIAGLALILGYAWVWRTFPTVTLDDMVLYLTLPLTGVDVGFIVNFLLYVVLAVLLIVLIAIRLRRVRAFAVLAPALSFGAFLAGVWLWEAKYGVYDYFFPDMKFYQYFEERTALVDAGEVTFDPERRNLIMIILESVDSAMTDGRTFSPPVMPELRALQEQFPSFRGHRDATGTSWSITSFFSMTTGVPMLSEPITRTWRNPLLVDSVDYSDAGGIPADHPLRRKSLLGILENHGYRVQLVRCASIQFAGYNILMRLECGNAEIHDLDYFTANRADTDGRTNSWGVHDSYAYERSRELLTEAAAGDRPFVHLVQTVNTHLPGFFENDLPREYNDVRDAFRQTDTLLARHVEWIRAQPFAEDTTIVVVGDHLTAHTEIAGVELPPPEEREIPVVLVNPLRDSPPRGFRRLFAAWDLAPTLLEAIGGTLPDGRLGLGTSLFADRETLFEREGVDDYDVMVRKRSRLYNELYRWH